MPEYANTPFVFNANEANYSAFRDGRRTIGCAVGRVALDARTKAIIDDAVNRIRAVVDRQGYDAVVFSQRGERLETSREVLD